MFHDNKILVVQNDAELGTIESVLNPRHIRPIGGLFSLGERLDSELDLFAVRERLNPLTKV
jgi:hypothetical protein